MINILDLFKSPPPKSPEQTLLDNQLEAASQQHAEWALKFYLQLVLDGLPADTAAIQTSFKFFGSYRE